MIFVLLELKFKLMSKRAVYTIFVFLLLWNGVFAQLDSLKSHSKYKKHLTWSDTFFGSEDMYQVCYPKDHRSMFYFIIIFSFTTIVLGLLVFYIKHQSNKRLKEKNDIIENQNKDLIDSINYAKRIQQALLPEKEIEDEVLANGFVLYRPKNIVSGDFYWLHKIDNIIYMAVIDCTGHGVPGALLTMLAYNAINKAVIEKSLHEPTQILDSMNDDIKSALKQNSDNTIRDSMEVAFVCLDVDTNQLSFAGANLSLTYIQDGELKIIKSGKCSVGSVQDRGIILPHTHVLNLKKGDCFYLYSDGYADQFGGPKSKKFKYKQLEELLLTNHQKPILEQRNCLNKTFENWMGSLEQVDDVTVIGYIIC
jgi:serine phosphatase RsbU (regulator of sigma subunit)